MTTFVDMYHPLIPSTAGSPVHVSPQAVDDYEARGWLEVDPQSPPVVVAPYLTQAAGDSRYLHTADAGTPGTQSGDALRAAYVPFWKAAETVTANTIRMAPDGSTIKRIANGTTRSSYDATEIALWTVTSSGGGGGGAVASVNGHTGTVILSASDVGADASGAAAAAQTAAQSYAVGAAAGLALVFGA